jgi:hypothetical protein
MMVTIFYIVILPSIVVAFFSCDNGLRQCIQNDSYCGVWKDRNFFPLGDCPYRQFTAAQARQCLGERTLLFTGDSQIRDLGIAVGLFLQGQTVHDSPDVKFAKRSKLIWENCTQIGYFESWGLKNKNSVNFDHNGYLFPKQEFAVQNPEWKWQIQVWEIYCNRMIHQGNLKEVLSNEMMKENNDTMQLKKIDLAFWNTGLHDCNLWDYPPYGQRYYDEIVRQWIDMRQLVPTPTVWVSMNNNCPDMVKDFLFGGKKIPLFAMVEEVGATILLCCGCIGL